MNNHEVRMIASHVNEVLYSDSSIEIPMRHLVKAIEEDALANGGIYPCESDMEAIVMPEDEGDEETNAKFAHLIALINEQF